MCDLERVVGGELIVVDFELKIGFRVLMMEGVEGDEKLRGGV